MGPQNVKILGPQGPRILKFWGPGDVILLIQLSIISTSKLLRPFSESTFVFFCKVCWVVSFAKVVVDNAETKSSASAVDNDSECSLSKAQPIASIFSPW